MNVFVVDVAAEHGGAVTILDQYLEEFKSDLENNYIVALSTINYDDCSNIRFVYYPWVKRSYIHRLWFDLVYCRKLIKKYRADKVLSLQNGAVSAGKVEQEVYFQNALPISEKRYSIVESKKLWIYQNVLGRYWRNSLKDASLVYVQAEWIKKALNEKWRIQNKKIIVKKPILDKKYSKQGLRNDNSLVFFYPANTALYKNHKKLIKAFITASDEMKPVDMTLVLTCDEEDLSERDKQLVEKNTNIKYVGKLNQEQMLEMYRSSTLIFPSLIETVGLPLMEAKATGAFILASDMKYAHEAVGEYNKVLYFDAFKADEIKSTIIEYVKWRLKNESIDR